MDYDETPSPISLKFESDDDLDEISGNESNSNDDDHASIDAFRVCSSAGRNKRGGVDVDSNELFAEITSETSDDIREADPDSSSVSPEIPDIVFKKSRFSDLTLPPSSTDLLVPISSSLLAVQVYEVCKRFSLVLRLTAFNFEDFCAVITSQENSRLLAEIHISLLRSLLRDEDLSGHNYCATDCKLSADLTYHLLDEITWPCLVSIYLLSVDSCPETVRSVLGHPNYPFVSAHSRLTVLSFMTDLVFLTGIIREELQSEGDIQYDTRCRKCGNLGNLLCCDNCPAVYHLECVNPPLSDVPTSDWICELCTLNSVPGVSDCLTENECSGTLIRQECLGYDRHLRRYWFLSRRLFVEKGDDVQYYSQMAQVKELITRLDAEYLEKNLCSKLTVLLPEMETHMEVTYALTRNAQLSKYNGKKLMLQCDLEQLEQFQMENPASPQDMEAVWNEYVDSDQEDACSFHSDDSLSKVVHMSVERQNKKAVGGDISIPQHAVLGIDSVNTTHYEENSDEADTEILTAMQRKTIFCLGMEEGFRNYKNHFNEKTIALSEFQRKEIEDKRKAVVSRYVGLQTPDLFIYGPVPLGEADNVALCVKSALKYMENFIPRILLHYDYWKSYPKGTNALINFPILPSELKEALQLIQSVMKPSVFSSNWREWTSYILLQRFEPSNRNDDTSNGSEDSSPAFNRSDRRRKNVGRPGLTDSLFRPVKTKATPALPPNWSIVNRFEEEFQLMLNETGSEYNVNVSIPIPHSLFKTKSEVFRVKGHGWVWQSAVRETHHEMAGILIDKQDEVSCSPDDLATTPLSRKGFQLPCYRETAMVDQAEPSEHPTSSDPTLRDSDLSEELNSLVPQQRGGLTSMLEIRLHEEEEHIDERLEYERNCQLRDEIQAELNQKKSLQKQLDNQLQSLESQLDAIRETEEALDTVESTSTCYACIRPGSQTKCFSPLCNEKKVLEAVLARSIYAGKSRLALADKKKDIRQQIDINRESSSLADSHVQNVQRRLNDLLESGLCDPPRSASDVFKYQHSIRNLKLLKDIRMKGNLPPFPVVNEFLAPNGKRSAFILLPRDLLEICQSGGQSEVPGFIYSGKTNIPIEHWPFFAPRASFQLCWQYRLASNPCSISHVALALKMLAACVKWEQLRDPVPDDVVLVNHTISDKGKKTLGSLLGRPGPGRPRTRPAPTISDYDPDDGPDDRRCRRKPGRSNIWSFFTKIGEKDFVQCNRCGVMCRRHGSTTTALWTHIRRSHPQLLDEVTIPDPSGGDVSDGRVDRGSPPSPHENHLLWLQGLPAPVELGYGIAVKMEMNDEIVVKELLDMRHKPPFGLETEFLIKVIRIPRDVNPVTSIKKSRKSPANASRYRTPSKSASKNRTDLGLRRSARTPKIKDDFTDSEPTVSTDWYSETQLEMWEVCLFLEKEDILRVRIERDSKQQQRAAAPRCASPEATESSVSSHEEAPPTARFSLTQAGPQPSPPKPSTGVTTVVDPATGRNMTVIRVDPTRLHTFRPLMGKAGATDDKSPSPQKIMIKTSKGPIYIRHPGPSTVVPVSPANTAAHGPVAGIRLPTARIILPQSQAQSTPQQQQPRPVFTNGPRVMLPSRFMTPSSAQRPVMVVPVASHKAGPGRPLILSGSANSNIKAEPSPEKSSAILQNTQSRVMHQYRSKTPKSRAIAPRHSPGNFYQPPPSDQLQCEEEEPPPPRATQRHKELKNEPVRLLEQKLKNQLHGHVQRIVKPNIRRKQYLLRKQIESELKFDKERVPISSQVYKLPYSALHPRENQRLIPDDSDEMPVTSQDIKDFQKKASEHIQSTEEEFVDFVRPPKRGRPPKNLSTNRAQKQAAIAEPRPFNSQSALPRFNHKRKNSERLSESEDSPAPHKKIKVEIGGNVQSKTSSSQSKSSKSEADEPKVKLEESSQLSADSDQQFSSKRGLQLTYGDTSTLHCICRTPYDHKKFYIKCELCLVWFHGKCVGLNGRVAKKMTEFVCDSCRKQTERDKLYCICKTPYDETKFYIGCDKCGDWFHGSCVGLTEQAAANIDDYFCPACRKAADAEKVNFRLNPGHCSELEAIMTDLMKHKFSWPFNELPTEQEYPNYYNVILKPIDFATILEKMRARRYKRLSDFTADMTRVFENSRRYHPVSSSEFQCTDVIERQFVATLTQFRHRNQTPTS